MFECSATAGQYSTFNFGFNGYGPQQMLVNIESGRVRRVVGDDPNTVSDDPEYAVYVALPTHAARVAGKFKYGRWGPRYRIDPRDSVRRDGNLSEKVPSPLEAELRWQLNKSAIYRLLADTTAPISEDDVKLMLAVVRQSRDLLKSQYPGIKFHVLLWPAWKGKDEVLAYRQLQDGFRGMNIPVHLVKDILPGHNSNSSTYVLSSYVLSPYDPHPNALADRLIADYVLTKIVSP